MGKSNSGNDLQIEASKTYLQAQLKKIEVQNYHSSGEINLGLYLHMAPSVIHREVVLPLRTGCSLARCASPPSS
jgi:hypothetical protein